MRETLFLNVSQKIGKVFIMSDVDRLIHTIKASWLLCCSMVATFAVIDLYPYSLSLENMQNYPWFLVFVLTVTNPFLFFPSTTNLGLTDHKLRTDLEKHMSEQNREYYKSFQE